MPKKQKYLVDGDSSKHCIPSNHRVRAWRTRSAYVVQVWLNQGHNAEPQGEPEGDWEMPLMFGLEAAVAQAVLQTT